MTDAELLAALIDLFEDREEAEHVARCPSCDVHSDGYEAGLYRCPKNPVSIREDAERQVLRERSAVIWMLQGCPPPTPLQVMMRKSEEMIVAGIREQLEHELPLFLRLNA